MAESRIDTGRINTISTYKAESLTASKAFQYRIPDTLLFHFGPGSGWR